MARARDLHAWLFIAAGLTGGGLYFALDHYHVSFVPTGDFTKGLWFGVCLGSELLGWSLLVRRKARSAN